MSEQHPIPDLTEDERACLLEYCGTKARDGVGDHAVDVIDTLRAMLLRAKTPESEQIVTLSEALSRWVEEWQTTEDARASFEEGFNRERRANKDLREQWDVLAAHAEERRIRAERLEAENATLRTALGIQESHSPPYTRAADDAERMGLNPAAPQALSVPAVQEMCCGGTCVRSMCPYHGGNQ
jgi:hypothetical protein